MNDLIKYHNDLNKIQLPAFNAQQMNIFFGIISKIRETPAGDKITFYQDELLGFSTENLTNKAIGEIIELLREKFFKADFKILLKDEERGLIGKATINLFQSFIVWYKDEKGHITNKIKKQNLFNSIELEINPRFAYIINELTKNFTMCELKEFIEIRGKYNKRLYLMLKQYRTTGLLKIEFDEFKRVLDILENYNQDDIDNRVLKPAILELSKTFKNLKYTKIKGKGRGRGGKVIGIEFTFDKEGLTENAIETQKPTENEALKIENQEIKTKNKRAVEALAEKNKENEALKAQLAQLSQEKTQESTINTQEIETLKAEFKKIKQRKENINLEDLEELTKLAKEAEYIVSQIQKLRNKNQENTQLTQKSTINDNNRDYEAEWRKLNEQEKKAIIAECQEPSEDEWKATITQEQIEALKAQYAKANSNELARLNNEAQANIGRYVYFNGTMVKIIHAEAFLNDETQQGENKYAIKIILEYESKHRIEIKKDNPFLFRKWLRENYL